MARNTSTKNKMTINLISNLKKIRPDWVLSDYLYALRRGAFVVRTTSGKFRERGGGWWFAASPYCSTFGQSRRQHGNDRPTSCQNRKSICGGASCSHPNMHGKNRNSLHGRNYLVKTTDSHFASGFFEEKPRSKQQNIHLITNQPAPTI